MFPKELLSKTKEERQQYFKNYVAGHTLLNDVNKQLLTCIGEPGCQGLVFIVGPTGVGKSTLVTNATQKLFRVQTASGEIPVVHVEAVSPDTGNFKWKDFFVRSLTALHEPLIDKKIDPFHKIKRTAPYDADINVYGTVDPIRRSLENALYFRKTRVFFIDEAQHIAKISSAKKTKDQQDTLKSLANVSGTLIVLVGGYDVLSLRSETGQLVRRSSIIHFPRYDAGNEEQALWFTGVIKTLQGYLPVPEQEDLTDEWDYFYERSLGCVGTLKDWFKRALWITLEKDLNSVSMETFKQCALSVTDCNTILSEIVEGENRIHQLQDEQESPALRQRLKLHPKEETKKASTPASKRPVGVRKPSRDPVGISSAPPSEES